ncbi:phytoene desaturase family protein [Alkalihalobacillus pseudalcaliphilus]|uniref:phytoene desaturase family protein n=1 Tax=Alkalihalobacillus pseudalcaliphilus TaxID=79884 RepID=UPI00064E09D6|nr:phytoene desaturase family protein [Alkalihalobacillus pseudalcaliphilus]KMK77567.1 diapolycopene oxygenase [Alkalihalobacillus pseudalcaliphilus]
MRSQKKKAIVIGAGLGGISSAISLAQAGFHIDVFEKNEHLGGKVNRLELDGFGFDLGPSILTMPYIFEDLFTKSNRVMKDYVKIKRLEHEWRAFHPGGDIINVYGDLDQMLHQNDLLSKKDMKDYQRFLRYAKKLYEATEKGYFAQGYDTTMEVMKQFGVFKSIREFDLHSTMYGAINRYIRNPKLKKTLAYFIKYVGSSPYEAPAVLNMMIYMQQQQGVWYVEGGIHRLAEGLVKLARELGVQFHTGQAVINMEKEKRAIKAIELEDGRKWTADYFVSNMEVIPAYERLLKVEEKELKKLEKKFEPSSSGLVLHLGVKANYRQLTHHNFFFSNDLKAQMDKVFKQKVLPDDPTIYLVNVNKTDSTQAPDGYENLKVLPHIPYIQDEPFSQEQYMKFRDLILAKLETMGLTDLRKNIVTEHMWTPHDIQRTYGSHRGSIYGTVSDKKKNKGFKHPKQSENFHNLFFTGGTVNPGAGMPMVVLSGKQVSDKIIAAENEKGKR